MVYNNSSGTPIIVCRHHLTLKGRVYAWVKQATAEVKSLATKLQQLIPATSLSGVERLVEHRSSVEGPLSLVQPNLLRLSVGIEEVEDLIDDLEHALAVI